MKIVEKYPCYLIEDAAHAIDSYYKDIPLGKFGHFSTFSFHETKNISSGEGGMLIINEPRFIQRAEIIREKGTNRSAFLRGEVDKYGWVDIGSSFLPSEITAAVLYAQLMSLQKIQKSRIKIWNQYYASLSPLAKKGFFDLPSIPAYATNNAHMFYLLCRSAQERQGLMSYLKSQGILAVFHFQSLHRSYFYRETPDGRDLPYSDFFTEHLVRLPLYCGLKEIQVNYIIDKIAAYYGSKR